jgi:hypothetical protein
MRTTAIATTSTASALRLVEDRIPTQLSPRAHEGCRMWRFDPWPGTG